MPFPPSAFLPTPPVPKLEVLSAQPKGAATGAPILFVHGAFCAAWIWKEHWLGHFAAHGRPAYALSLRGHGESEGHDRLRDTSLSEFVDDLAHTVHQIIESTGRPPVILGHSMGGMVVQRWLERQSADSFRNAPTAAAIILLSSVPPGGLFGTTVHMALSDPLLLWQIAAIQTFGETAATLGGVQRAMFSDDVPQDLLAGFLSRMQGESVRAQADMSMAPPPVSTNGRSLPMLVLGADHDAFVPPWMAQTTARHYDAECVILEKTGHASMLGPAWKRTATTLEAWLKEKDL